MLRMPALTVDYLVQFFLVVGPSIAFHVGPPGLTTIWESIHLSLIINKHFNDVNSCLAQIFSQQLKIVTVIRAKRVTGVYKVGHIHFLLRKNVNYTGNGYYKWNCVHSFMFSIRSSKYGATILYLNVVALSKSYLT